jgi:hypothetical protein
MTLSFGKPKLSSRILINVPLTVSCSPFNNPSLTVFSEFVSVNVEQAAGKDIAQGAGGASGFLPTLLFPCDGSSNTVAASVIASATTGVPFHGGPAIFSATGSAFAGEPCPGAPPGCFIGREFQGAAIAPTTLKL